MITNKEQEKIQHPIDTNHLEQYLLLKKEGIHFIRIKCTEELPDRHPYNQSTFIIGDVRIRRVGTGDFIIYAPDFNELVVILEKTFRNNVEAFDGYYWHFPLPKTESIQGRKNGNMSGDTIVLGNSYLSIYEGGELYCQFARDKFQIHLTQELAENIYNGNYMTVTAKSKEKTKNKLKK